MSLNKKGALGFEWGRLFINLMVTSVVIIFVIVVVLAYLSQDINTGELETKILAKAITDSPECLGFNSNSGYHSGLINPQKIDPVHLSNCIVTPTKGFRVVLKNFNGDLIKDATVSNGIYDKDAFLACSKFSNNLECHSIKRYVQYKEGALNKNGVLEIEVMGFAK